MERLKIEVDNFKYRIEQNSDGSLEIFRYDEPWLKDPQGSKMIIAMAFEIQTLRAETKALVMEKMAPAGSETGKSASASRDLETLIPILAEDVKNYLDDLQLDFSVSLETIVDVMREKAHKFTESQKAR